MLITREAAQQHGQRPDGGKSAYRRPADAHDRAHGEAGGCKPRLSISGQEAGLPSITVCRDGRA